MWKQQAGHKFRRPDAISNRTFHDYELWNRQTRLIIVNFTIINC